MSSQQRRRPVFELLKRLVVLVPPIRRLRDERNQLARELRMQTPERDLLAQMQRQRIDLVIDVGANKGQFATRLREIGHRGPIISFEPQGAAFAELKSKCDRDPGWRCHHMALGDVDGEAAINISGNSDSSSLLPVHDRTVALNPLIAYIGREMVTVRRLHSLGEMFKAAERIFLKIDAQGFERQVLDGARGMFDQVALVQLELAWTPSYHGQASMGEMVDQMRALGFEPALASPAWLHKPTGLIPEIDVTFIRSRRLAPLGQLPSHQRDQVERDGDKQQVLKPEQH